MLWVGVAVLGRGPQVCRVPGGAQALLHRVLLASTPLGGLYLGQSMWASCDILKKATFHSPRICFFGYNSVPQVYRVPGGAQTLFHRVPLACTPIGGLYLGQDLQDTQDSCTALDRTILHTYLKDMF